MEAMQQRRRGSNAKAIGPSRGHLPRVVTCPRAVPGVEEEDGGVGGRYPGVEEENGGINISGTKLNGTFPATIGELTMLVKLQIVYSGLTGPLPSLAKLDQLQSLRIEGNTFVGPGLVPADFFTCLEFAANLGNVQTLRLDGKNFNGRLLDLLNLTAELEELYLNNNRYMPTTCCCGNNRHHGDCSHRCSDLPPVAQAYDKGGGQGGDDSDRGKSHRGFSDANLVVKDGCGKVYKGVLPVEGDCKSLRDVLRSTELPSGRLFHMASGGGRFCHPVLPLLLLICLVAAATDGNKWNNHVIL
uniref:Uncharacterized protein n=1 Tax=Oryza sativa subsp. japonica TaxID=39947 RepID=Q9LIV1_ORYSJ|nr:hypothetical protein [Oryza sativa Japonica Group]BAA90518.1 unnamed protein product [Oryza sativa]